MVFAPALMEQDARKRWTKRFPLITLMTPRCADYHRAELTVGSVMLNFMLDLEAIAEKTGLIAENELTWTDGDVPMHTRGVSVDWLIDFVHEVNRNWQTVVERHKREERASFYFDAPWPDPLPFYECPEITPLFLVNHVIRPMTKALAGPLFARLPSQ